MIPSLNSIASHLVVLHFIIISSSSCYYYHCCCFQVKIPIYFTSFYIFFPSTQMLKWICEIRLWLVPKRDLFCLHLTHTESWSTEQPNCPTSPSSRSTITSSRRNRSLTVAVRSCDDFTHSSQSEKGRDEPIRKKRQQQIHKAKQLCWWPAIMDVCGIKSLLLFPPIRCTLCLSFFSGCN